MAPVGSRPTEPPDAIHAEFVLEFPPATASALLGFGGVTGMWAMSMLVAEWQAEQSESLACGPPTWARPGDCVSPAALSASVMPWPVAKLMPSWQAPQASRFGSCFQLSPSLVLVVRGYVLEPSWHDVQLRMSCGNVVAAGNTPA